MTGFPIRATLLGAFMALVISTVFPYGILASGTFLGPLLCGAVGSLSPDWPGGVLLLPGVVIVVCLGLLLLLAAHSSRKYGFRLT